MKYLVTLFVLASLTACTSSTNSLQGTWQASNPAATLVIIDASNAYLRINEQERDGHYVFDAQEKSFQFNWGLDFLVGQYKEGKIRLTVDDQTYAFMKSSAEVTQEALAYHRKTSEEKQLQRKFEAREGNGTKPGTDANAMPQMGLQAVLEEALRKMQNGTLTEEEAAELDMTEDELESLLQSLDSLQRAAG